MCLFLAGLVIPRMRASGIYTLGPQFLISDQSSMTSEIDDLILAIATLRVSLETVLAQICLQLVELDSTIMHLANNID